MSRPDHVCLANLPTHSHATSQAEPLRAAGEYSSIQNSALAEQKNSSIRRLENQVSFMKQTTFMYYMRYYLYRMNKLQEQQAADLCLFK